MTRRTLLAALASVPFVRRWAKAAPAPAGEFFAIDRTVAPPMASVFNQVDASIARTLRMLQLDMYGPADRNVMVREFVSRDELLRMYGPPAQPTYGHLCGVLCWGPDGCTEKSRA